MKHSADMRLVVDKKAVTMKIDRDQKFWMVKSSEGWKTEGWPGYIKGGEHEPVH